MLSISGSLIQQQQELVGNILNEDQQDFSDTGLMIYKTNLRLTAARSLSLTYPVISRMIGSESLGLLATRLLKTDFPSTGDWAEWGEGLPELLADSELHVEHIYLEDVAKLEWMRHKADKARTTIFDQKTLEKLVNSSLSSSYLALTDGFDILQSDWPVDVLWESHQPEVKDPGAYLSASSFKFQSQYWAVYQQSGRPQHQSITDDEHLWLLNIKRGYSIDALIDAQPNFDFTHWLPKAINNNWLVKID
ncbi:HvfC/BufC family peptide modification chaperone [Pseudomaricurvus sp.]|uniref:HvfC/BufC family peptide modification chaperone n=1 Tax=Pseudomaricurvus sp. TaxID=2004510 RepID=UPI003F6C58B8